MREELLDRVCWRCCLCVSPVTALLLRSTTFRHPPSRNGSGLLQLLTANSRAVFAWRDIRWLRGGSDGVAVWCRPLDGVVGGPGLAAWLGHVARSVVGGCVAAGRADEYVVEICDGRLVDGSRLKPIQTVVKQWPSLIRPPDTKHGGA